MNGSRTVTSVAVEGPMIPSQPPTSKRKATDDANPLAAIAGKKLKRDVRALVYSLLSAMTPILVVSSSELEGGAIYETQA